MEISNAIEVGRELLVKAISDYVKSENGFVECNEVDAYIHYDPDDEIQTWQFRSVKYDDENGFLANIDITMRGDLENYDLTPEEMSFDEMVEMSNRFNNN